MKTQLPETVDAVLEQAARWHARMDCGTADIADFEHWRSADPRNAAAFARIAGTAAQVSKLKPVLKRARAGTTRRSLWQAAAASAAVVFFGGGAYLVSGGGRASAKTPIGGQMLRTLPDGGRLHINTNSEVQWRLNAHTREVWLERGEIALTVPRDKQPLLFHGGGQTVEVVAGRINARLRNGSLDLLVLEGAVRMAKTDGVGGAKVGQLVVEQGQAVLAGQSGTRLRPLSTDDIQFVSAWQSGEVYFNGETLGTAVEEYNRYLTDKITIGDPSLQALRLGGRFNSHDPQVFLASLHAAFAITINRTPDGSIVLTR